jgi:hypothetical protein
MVLLIILFFVKEIFMFNKLKKFWTESGNVIQFELDDWYKWYKEPQKFHDAVVEHLAKEGRKVETLHVSKSVTSNRIATLRVDGIEYELSVKNILDLGPAQTVILRKVE